MDVTVPECHLSLTSERWPNTKMSVYAVLGWDFVSFFATADGSDGFCLPVKLVRSSQQKMLRTVPQNYW